MTTFRPYEEIERPGLGMFGGLPSAPPGTVLVVDREGQPLRALMAHDDRLTAGETRFGRVRTLYRVNVAETRVEFDAELPCKDGDGAFTARLGFVFRVDDPVAVVRRQVRDAVEVLVPLIRESARQVCGRYEAEQRKEAEAEVLAVLRETESARRHDDAFLVVRFWAELTPDAAATEYLRSLKEDRRTGSRQSSQAELELARGTHEARLAGQKAEQEAELGRQKAALDAQHARLTAEFETELFTRRQWQQEQEAKLEAERLKLELENAALRARLREQEVRGELRIEELRTDQYIRLLERGDFAVLAMRLLQEPDTIHQVAAQLAQQRGAIARQQMEALQILLQNDALEGWDVSDKAKAVLNQLLDSWTATARQIQAGAVAPPDPAAALTPGPTPAADTVVIGEEVADIGADAAPDAPREG